MTNPYPLKKKKHYVQVYIEESLKSEIDRLAFETGIWKKVLLSELVRSVLEDPERLRQLLTRLRTANPRRRKR